MRRLTLPPGALESPRPALSPEAVHYARRVLRLPVGAEVALCDGAGARAVGALEDDAVVIRARAPVARRTRPQLFLMQAVGKSDKMDAVVRAAAELGAARVQPFTSARTVARRTGAIARWRGIAEDALRVSGRPFRTEVAEVVELDALVATGPEGVGWVASLGAETPWRSAMSGPPPEAMTFVVGPEGGLTDAEREALDAAGWRSLSMGPYTLRTETAGAALLAAARCAWTEEEQGNGG